MPTATISKSVTKGEDLVVIPRKEYEALLRAKTSIVSRSHIIGGKHSMIEARLRNAEEDIKAERMYGPFQTVKEMIDSLHQ